jgi:hypothetical protein
LFFSAEVCGYVATESLRRKAQTGLRRVGVREQADIVGGKDDSVVGTEL